jgi:hypothetical protein
MNYDDSDRVIWFKFSLFVIAIILGFGNALRADDLYFDSGDDYVSDKKIYLIKDISTGSSIQPVFIYRSGDLWFYRNLQTGEGFKTLWVK